MPRTVNYFTTKYPNRPVERASYSKSVRFTQESLDKNAAYLDRMYATGGHAAHTQWLFMSIY